MAAIIRIESQASVVYNPTAALKASKYLSPFQIEKYTYMFNNIFDLERNSLLEHNDIIALVERLAEYTGWPKDSPHYIRLADVFRIFYECLKDQVQAEKAASEEDDELVHISWTEAIAYDKSSGKNTAITLQQWLNMWGRLCHGAAGLSGFPIWVQLLPEVFFEVIDRDHDGVCSFQEVKNFYESFVGVPVDKLDKVAREGYRAMTANGDYVLTRENYYFCFANFLLGRTIYGPGKYIFGVFDNREMEEQFSIKYNDE